MAKRENKALLQEGTKKEEAIYIRIDPKTLGRISEIQKRYKHRTRSHTIRAILQWAFDNGIEVV